ncbi:MAG TPA: RDD family protein [Solirubrobacteraceae bacterium]|jgi:uncharacterized RDD family membrane protein YckC
MTTTGKPEEEAAAAAARARAAHVAAAARAQAAAAARARDGAAARGPSAAEAQRTGEYAGLATRAIAYAADIVLIDLVALVVAGSFTLAMSLIGGLPHRLKTVAAVLGAALYLLWAIAYFVTFWSTNGQTPGSRLMRIRVVDARGAPHVGFRRALVRLVGLVLATIPLCAGFLIMLWDGRRRCLQDRMARTVVVHAPAQVRIVRQWVARDDDG